jgi:hypothetical protein
MDPCVDPSALVVNGVLIGEIGEFVLDGIPNPVKPLPCQTLIHK